MQSLDYLVGFPALFSAVVGLIGLLVGSFLNVVIYRLPIMMQLNWRKDCQEYLGLDSEPQAEEPFNLVFPLSRCPGCNTPIKPYQNIPVISYVFLRGKCANCKNPISLRYPIIEAFTALTSFVIANCILVLRRKQDLVYC